VRAQPGKHNFGGVMAPTPPLIENPVPNCFQVLVALRELLHLACHRRSLYFAERELDGKFSSISAAEKLYVIVGWLVGLTFQEFLS